MSRAKTLVTGATGMTGSHTLQLLLKRGHTVRVLGRTKMGTENENGDRLLFHDGWTFHRRFLRHCCLPRHETDHVPVQNGKARQPTRS